MLKHGFIHTLSSLILSFSSFCIAQEKAVEILPQAIGEEEIFKEVRKVLSEDLSNLKHPIKPMLWKIEGNGLKKASYLFGSIHVSDKNITTLHPAAEAAYQQADTLATEVNFGFFNQIRTTNFMIRKDKKTLEESIGEKLYKELNTQLIAIEPTLSAKPFNNMKTWAMTFTFSMLEEQLKQGGKFLDIQLWEKASKDEKARWELETVTEQMGGFDKLTDEEQTILLKDTLFITKKLEKENINILTMLKKLYLKGDSEKIISSLTLLGKLEGTNLEVAEKNWKIMLEDRNVGMAAKIQETFKEQPDKSHFIVAGTLHYLGENSVVEILLKQGYSVTRLEK